MDAGRELDAKVAAAMGLRIIGNEEAARLAYERYRERYGGDFCDMDDHYRVGNNFDTYIVDDGYFWMKKMSAYSSDIAAAWDVVEWMRGRGEPFILFTGSPPWYASFLGEDESEVADTAPLAICRAFLSAVTSQVRA